MKTDNTLKAIDLFCGCGGLSLGLEKAGFQVVAASEILPHVRKTYQVNHPNTLTFADIRGLTGSELLKTTGLKRGELDLLAGCPPCQGFSSLRTRNGSVQIQDDRNELIFEFIRIALEIRPKTILIENVPALMTDERIEKTKQILINNGYSVSLSVLNAADFGVPQRRKRMILMASRLGNINSLIPGNNKQHTVFDAIGQLPAPGMSGNWMHDLKRNHTEKVMNIIKRIPKNGGSRSALGDDQLPCHKKLGGGFRDVYGRMSWSKVSPTITRSCTNPSKGRFLHPVEDRSITLLEAAILQSFPKGYKFPKSFLNTDQVSSMIGEALPPKFAAAQGEHLKKHLVLFIEK